MYSQYNDDDIILTCFQIISCENIPCTVSQGKSRLSCSLQNAIIVLGTAHLTLVSSLSSFSLCWCESLVCVILMFTVMVGVFSLLTSDYRQWSELHIHQWPHLNSSSIAMFCHVVTLHCCHYTSILSHQQHYIAVTTQAHCLNHCTVAHRNSTSQADRVLSYVCVWGGASKTCDTQGPSLIVTHRNNQLWQYKLKTVDTWFSMQNMGLVGVHIALRTDVFPLLHSWSGKCYSSFCKVIGASFGNDLIHHYYQKKLMWLSRLCLACS